MKLEDIWTVFRCLCVFALPYHKILRIFRTVSFRLVRSRAFPGHAYYLVCARNPFGNICGHGWDFMRFTIRSIWCRIPHVFTCSLLAAAHFDHAVAFSQWLGSLLSRLSISNVTPDISVGCLYLHQKAARRGLRSPISDYLASYLWFVHSVGSCVLWLECLDKCSKVNISCGHDTTIMRRISNRIKSNLERKIISIHCDKIVTYQYGCWPLFLSPVQHLI